MLATVWSGDPVYGGRRKIAKGALPEEAAEAIASFPRQALHAATLGFTHPVTGQFLRYAADPPDDMCDLVKLLRGRNDCT